jgi:hypothetical protein
MMTMMMVMLGERTGGKKKEQKWTLIKNGSVLSLLVCEALERDG